MKLAGLVGGLGPESTIDYYKQVIALYRERVKDGSYPELVIASVDVSKGIRLASEHRHEELTGYMVAAIERLARAGASFAAITANTPHVVFDEIARRSPIPLVSIVEAACAEAKRRNLRKLGLVGSRMTMEARFFPEVFARAGLAVVAPNAADQKLIHEKYINELVPGKFFPETRDALLAAIGRLSAEQGIDAVLLAGTELPLLLKDESHGGVPLLDTTKIHVVEIVDEMVANPHSSQSRA